MKETQWRPQHSFGLLESLKVEMTRMLWVDVKFVVLVTTPKTKVFYPPKTCPWATPMQPITSAANSEVGTAPVGLIEGTWVVGFFQDGENAQQPIFMGTIGGIPLSPQLRVWVSTTQMEHIQQDPDFPTHQDLRTETKEGTSVEFKEANIDEMLPASHLFGEPIIPNQLLHTTHRIHITTSHKRSLVTS